MRVRSARGRQPAKWAYPLPDLRRSLLAHPLRRARPTAFYPNTLLLYTYGKALLSPGQRIGYIALPPTMLGRELLREALLTAQLLTGWAFPNVLLQHALADFEPLSIDLGRLEKRDWLVTESVTRCIARKEPSTCSHAPL